MEQFYRELHVLLLAVTAVNVAIVGDMIRREVRFRRAERRALELLERREREERRIAQ